jgi:spore coat polysaccharide biosynthesis protein SpsF (cytidylyltransferase family)
MLARVVKRCQRALSVNQVVVATSNDLADDAVEHFCLAQVTLISE